MTMVLITPIPPTSSATAPSPNSQPVKATSAAALADSTTEGLETWTSLGFDGLAAYPSSDATFLTAAGFVLTKMVVTSASISKYVFAAGQPMNTPKSSE